MQPRLGERFDDYMRDFLLKEGQPVRPDEVYQEWRKRLGPLDEDDIRDVLRELGAWSLEYDQILHPQRESDAEVRKHLQRLDRLVKDACRTSSIRSCCGCNADYRRGDLTAEQVTRIFVAIESLFVRRLFTSAPVARRQPAADRALRRAAAATGPRRGIRGSALAGRSSAGRTTLISPTASLRYPLYFASHPDQRKLILEALEDSYEHRAPVRYEQLDLQLITPLLPRADWLAELGVTEDQYWKVIGTLGNFTWVPRGRAPDLGVAERKKELLRMTRYGLELVKDFAQVERWTAEEIEQRGRSGWANARIAGLAGTRR